jgi:hypothetical protein
VNRIKAETYALRSIPRLRTVTVFRGFFEARERCPFVFIFASDLTNQTSGSAPRPTESHNHELAEPAPYGALSLALDLQGGQVGVISIRDAFANCR